MTASSNSNETAFPPLAERVLCPHCGVSTYYFPEDDPVLTGRPEYCIHCHHSFHVEVCDCGKSHHRKLISAVECEQCHHVVRPYRELVRAGEFPAYWSGLRQFRTRRDLPGLRQRARHV